MIPISKPVFGEEEINTIREVVESGLVSQGEKVKEFEEAFAKYIGTDFAIATNSGTSALHTALASLLHYVVALRGGVDPRKLGLSKDGKYAYIQCVNPGEPYTEGGTVIFKCYRVKEEEMP